MVITEIDKLVFGTFKKKGYERTRQRCSWLISPLCQNKKNENEMERFYRYLKRTTVRDRSDLTTIEETTTPTKKKMPKLSFEASFDFELTSD